MESYEINYYSENVVRLFSETVRLEDSEAALKAHIRSIVNDRGIEDANRVSIIVAESKDTKYEWRIGEILP